VVLEGKDIVPTSLLGWAHAENEVFY